MLIKICVGLGISLRHLIVGVFFYSNYLHNASHKFVRLLISMVIISTACSVEASILCQNPLQCTSWIVLFLWSLVPIVLVIIG
jgi:hypothetical protein